MKMDLDFQLSAAALVCSVLALFFSMLAAFPGLKTVVAAIRDGVLWFALFLILGGSAFVVWQQVQKQPATGLASQGLASQGLASHAKAPAASSVESSPPGPTFGH
jgi:hypothetical protein